jgi:hypothetical protein
LLLLASGFGCNVFFELDPNADGTGDAHDADAVQDVDHDGDDSPAEGDVAPDAPRDDGNAEVDETGDTPDADTEEADAAEDAAADADDGDGGDETCRWSAGPPVFGAPVSLGASNSTANDADPTLPADELTVYFVTVRTGDNDIFSATRASRADAFGAASVVASVSTTANETHYILSSTGLEAFVSTNRTGTVGLMDIFRATRPTIGDAWSAFTSVPFVNSTNHEFDPHLEWSGQTLWLSTLDRPGGAGAQDLYVAFRPDVGSAFGAATPVVPLNTSFDEWDPSLPDDALTVVFSSNRLGEPHVYYSTRSDRVSAFGPPVLLDALEPYSATLVDPFVSSDGCRIFFGAGLADSIGGKDLYVVEAIP